VALDFEHLIEEVADLGKSERFAVRSQLRRIIEHSLKLAWSLAREPRPGWHETIIDARTTLYCEGNYGCTGSTARMQALDRCRRHNVGEDCKIYAIGRIVVWQDADAPRPEPQLSASERLIKECLAGGTSDLRIDKCSQAIASPELAQYQKRGAFYVRARAYEQIGYMAEAERDYRAVLSIDPDHLTARARLDGLRGPAVLPSPTRPNSA
jgi:hypothetical protein